MSQDEDKKLNDEEEFERNVLLSTHCYKIECERERRRERGGVDFIPGVDDE